MSVNTPRIVRVCLGCCAAAGLALTLATPAGAQPGDYDRYDTGPSYPGGVTVTAPPFRERDSATGAPIEWVSASRAVRYDDLDLSRSWDAHVLRARVARAARAACDQLDAFYPIDAPNNPPCVRNAIRDAMDRTPIGY